MQSCQHAQEPRPFFRHRAADKKAESDWGRPTNIIGRHDADTRAAYARAQDKLMPDTVISSRVRRLRARCRHAHFARMMKLIS